jgi:hypothetical protein
MKKLLWKLLAKIVTTEFVRSWLINRALKTPYTHIASACGSRTYMQRYWLFNPYHEDQAGIEVKKYPFTWLPSIRLHCILMPDQDRHLHDHPWDMAKTIILRGWYTEELLNHSRFSKAGDINDLPCGEFHRITGTPDQSVRYAVTEDKFHRISDISKNGVLTLFFAWNFQEPWGFLVDGKKINHKLYLANQERYQERRT